MNNLEKWLISIEPEKVIEEIRKRACSECPAAEYCKNSPLNFCTEVLYAWAKRVRKNPGQSALRVRLFPCRVRRVSYGGYARQTKGV